MSDIEARAARKIGRGFMSVLKGVGEGLAAISEAAAERQAELQKVQDAVDEFNSRYSPEYMLIRKSDYNRLTEAQERKCGYNTSFWDCEDHDCYYHKAEKTRRGIGTPTRDYRPQ